MYGNIYLLLHEYERLVKLGWLNREEEVMNSEIEEGINKSMNATPDNVTSLSERKASMSPALGEPYGEQPTQSPEEAVKEIAATVEPTPEQIGEAWAVDAVKDAMSKPTQKEALQYIKSLSHMATSLVAIEVFNKINNISDKNKRNQAMAALMSDFSGEVRKKVYSIHQSTKKGNAVLLEQGTKTNDEN